MRGKKGPEIQPDATGHPCARHRVPSPALKNKTEKKINTMTASQMVATGHMNAIFNHMNINVPLSLPITPTTLQKFIALGANTSSQNL